MREAAGIVNLLFNISKTITDIIFKQVTVEQHMKVMQTKKKVLFKNTPTHSNQQLATPCGHFCAKLLSDCKEFDADVFLHYYTMFARSACNFML